MADTLGYRKMIGIVVPSVNSAVQPECDEMRPEGVTNHIARIVTPKLVLKTDADFIKHVETMRAGILDAVDQVMMTEPDFLIMGLSLEAFWEGVEGAGKMLERIAEHAGVPTTMGSDSIRAALDAYGGIRRLGLITPHRPLGDERVRAYFTEAGYEVAGFKSFNCMTGAAIARVPADALRAAVDEVDGENVDAIVQVGTNLAMARVAAEAEEALGKPVIAMNAATYWHALRKCGIDDKVPGFGRLLEEW
jgi:maleate isomerase